MKNEPNFIFITPLEPHTIESDEVMIHIVNSNAIEWLNEKSLFRYWNEYSNRIEWYIRRKYRSLPQQWEFPNITTTSNRNHAHSLFIWLFTWNINDTFPFSSSPSAGPDPRHYITKSDKFYLHFSSNFFTCCLLLNEGLMPTIMRPSIPFDPYIYTVIICISLQ